MGNRYLEMQIWRPVGLEDVERFEFTGPPPSGDFPKALRHHGVKIFRRDAAHEWHENPAGPSSSFRVRLRPVLERAPSAIAA